MSETTISGTAAIVTAAVPAGDRQRLRRRHGSFAPFVARRLLTMLVQVFALSVLVFLLIRLLPGDPAAAILGPHGSPEARESLRARMGLDGSVVHQYIVYIGGVARGDLGYSWFTGSPVSSDLSTRAAATIELIGLAAAVAIAAGFIVGVLSVRSQGKGPVAFAMRWYSRLAGSFPDFWVAMLATFIFSFVLQWAPAPVGRLSLSTTPPPRRTGLMIIDSLLAGDGYAFTDAVAHLALPVLVLGLIVAPMIGRVVAVALERTMASDYYRYARSSGLPPHVMAWYVTKSVLPSLVTISAVVIIFLLSGAVLIERIFAWNGVGQYVTDAVSNADFAAIQGFILVAGVFTVLVNLAADVIIASVDPRARLS